MKENHKKLIKEATERLKSIGISKISYEARLPNNGKVDILAFQNDDRIAVECLVQVQIKNIRKKILTYRPYLSRLIFLVPPGEAYKLKDIPDVDEIWKSKEVTVKWTVLRVSAENYVKLTKIKGQITSRTGEDTTYDQVIAELLQTAK